MSGESGEETIVRIRAVLSEANSCLAAAGAREEALAEYVPPRRILFVTRQATMVPIGRVWRLGVFLLDREGTLYATGATTRAVDPKYPGYQSISAEERRAFRAAAFRARFPHGETINYATAPIELDAASLRTSSGPLFLDDGSARVRWSPSVGDESATPFDAYIAERVELLAHPPEGA